ncbi:RluA family pseudouridine synthase [Planctomycetota bacterium]
MQDKRAVNLNQPLRVLFEDDDVLAVDKPEHMAAIADRQGRGDDLFSIISRDRSDRLFVVHRLDREVSGVILFAKHAEAHRSLNEQFSQRCVAKCYRALVHGCPEHEVGRLSFALRQFGSGRMGVDETRGKACLTNYRVLEKNEAFSQVEVHPVTGRRHQIRVHLYAAGFPIVGDPLYGDKQVQSGYARLMLHAASISLTAPSGNTLEVSSPIPVSYRQLLEHLTK